jgi:hypothetical protein
MKLIQTVHNLPAYKIHQHRTVQTVHAATKQKTSTFFKIILWIFIQQGSHEHFNVLLLLSCICNNFNNSVTLASTSFTLPEDDTD